MKDEKWKVNYMKDLELNLNNFCLELKEETYNLDDLDPFVDFVIRKFKAPMKKRYDVTHFFKKFLKKPSQKVFFAFKINDKGGIAQVSTTFEDEISISIDRKVFKTVKERSIRKTLIKQALRHELIHALDYLKSKRKPKEVDPNEKIKKPKGNTFLRYFLDKMEFNRAINELARSKKKNDTLWDSFYNSETLVNALYEFLSDQSIAYPDTKENIKKDVMQVLSDPIIKKRIIKRLARENLLPEFLEKENEN